MLAPTPVLKPSPIDIGGLFSAGSEALKRRFGLLVLITLMPSIVILAVFAVGTTLLLPAIVAASNGDRVGASAGLIAGMVVLIVGTLLAVLVQLKSYGMLSLAAYEIAQGQRPDFRGVLARSRGFLSRMAGVIALGLGVAVAVTLLLVGLFAAIARMPSGSDAESMMPVAALGAVWLVVLAFFPVALFLQTRLLYTVPAIALEQESGIAALGRSWRLTRGAFWRTLGYYLVAQLAVSAVSYAVSLVGQVAIVPLSMGISESSSPERAFGTMMALIPALAILFALQVLVQVVTIPFLQSYITYMFIDQVRRSETPATPPYGYPGGGYYAQPGQYYNQQPSPPQPQQHPAQGWQAPGGWTPPGPAQPPQQWGQQYPPQRWDGGQQGQQQPPGQDPTPR